MGKCQSRIKVLETLAAGTTEEIQVPWIDSLTVLPILFEFHSNSWFLSSYLIIQYIHAGFGVTATTN